MHNTQARDLHSPARLGPYELPNRLVMAPLTRSRAGSDRLATTLMAEYYAQRATAGLIVSEAAQISPQGIGYPGTPGIHTAEQVAAWRTVTDAVHARGGRIVMQLWHVGRISHPSMQPDGGLPVAPSAIAPTGMIFTATGPQPYITPRALEFAEIPAVVADYGAAARLAREAGFDGVEIHGAHGYLIDQFLRDGTNHRTDAYGGSIRNRTRFLQEVTAAVVDAWGADRVGVRLSPLSSRFGESDSDPAATFTHAARVLNDFGLAYLHLVEPVANGPLAITPPVREAFHGTIIGNGGYDQETANRTIASGLVDLVSFGSLFLANPDLPERFRVGAPLNHPDPSTFYGGDERGYTDYPMLEEVGALD
jgi:N-ethylmaleimide reductase